MGRKPHPFGSSFAGLNDCQRATGRLGSAVADALLAAGPGDLRLSRLAVRGMPGSGTPAELLAWAGIDAEHIAAAARGLVHA